MEREINAEKAEAAKVKKKKVDEEGKRAMIELVLSSPSSSGDSRIGYCISLRSCRLKMKCISRDMRCGL